jgi:hypothetical protein
LRAFQLQRRPLDVTPEAVATALGRRDAAAALSFAGDALPSLRGWEAELRELSPQSQHDLVRRADDVVAHRFDLLGSGPTDLGPDIDWHRDFKSGRIWPLRHISRVTVSYPDASDIKVPWELSRFQHLPLLAAAYQLTTDRRYLDELGNQLRSWIASNPVEFGVNWACTMDVAIRAVNWIAALAMCASETSESGWLDEVIASLLLHGRFIRGHLELGSARGNHYLSDVVGLLVVAGVFADSSEGRDWIRWAVGELAKEMEHQVRVDGCDHEASVSYHRLVTELFIVGAHAAERLAPGELDPGVRTGIERMLRFVADYTRPDGLAPQIGDADNGRLLPLGDYAASDQRSHLHLFRQADRSYRPAKAPASYPEGGFYFMRAGAMYAAVRCGDVGIYGRGCHAHNDIMGFELCFGETPLVVDPGSYLYTADAVARNRFRSTAAHSTLQIDRAEQNELRAERLFALVDRARPEVLAWETSRTSATLTGRHHGFEALRAPATHTRTIHLDAEKQTLEIVDEVVSDEAHELAWTFQMAPCSVEITPDGLVVAHFPEVAMQIRGEGLIPTVEERWISPGYGTCGPAPAVRLHGRSRPRHHRSVIVLSLPATVSRG